MGLTQEQIDAKAAEAARKAEEQVDEALPEATTDDKQTLVGPSGDEIDIYAAGLGREIVHGMIASGYTWKG